MVAEPTVLGTEGGFAIPPHLAESIAECADGERVLCGCLPHCLVSYDKCWLCGREQMFTCEDDSGGTCLWCGERQNQHPAMKRCKLTLQGIEVPDGK